MPSPRTRFRIPGYPGSLWLRLLLNRLIHTPIFLAFFTASLLGTFGTAYLLITDPSFAKFLQLLLCAIPLYLFACVLKNFFTSFLVARIVLYFDKQAHVHFDTFLRGAALARNFRLLHRLAKRHNLVPLSSFGFRDEPLNKWHDPVAGLQTIEGLLDLLRRYPEFLFDQFELLHDLEAYRDALMIAAERQIQFCLLFRLDLDQVVSPMEFDRRRGYFW